MKRLVNYLSVSDILLDVEATSKKRVFEQAGLLFENHHGVARAKIYDSLFAREKLGSTGLGQGIAVPHGRLKGIKEAKLAIIRLKEPIAFDSLDGQPVQLIFVLIVPESATQQHLDIFATIAEHLSHKALRDALLQASEPGQIYQLLANESYE